MFQDTVSICQRFMKASLGDKSHLQKSSRGLWCFRNLVSRKGQGTVWFSISLVYRTEKVTSSQKKFRFGLNCNYFHHDQEYSAAETFGIRPCCCVCKACPYPLHFDVTYQGCLFGECCIFVQFMYSIILSSVVANVRIRLQR